MLPVAARARCRFRRSGRSFLRPARCSRCELVLCYRPSIVRDDRTLSDAVSGRTRRRRKASKAPAFSQVLARCWWLRVRSFSHLPRSFSRTERCSHLSPLADSIGDGPGPIRESFPFHPCSTQRAFIELCLEREAIRSTFGCIHRLLHHGTCSGLGRCSSSARSRSRAVRNASAAPRKCNLLGCRADFAVFLQLWKLPHRQGPISARTVRTVPIVP